MKRTPGVDSPEWTLEIRPRRPWLALNLGELWQSWDLVMLLVRRDFVSVYKQTILGPLWFLIQPVLTAVTFTVIFGRIAELPSDGLPPFLFYLSGTVIWSYFSACLTKTADTFISNAAIFGKVYFPRLAIPVSILITNLFAFTIQFALFLAFTLYFWIAGVPIKPHATLLLLPFLVLLMAGLGLGCGIIVSSLTTRYRDLQHLVSFGVQLLMFATPVLYPLSSVPERYRLLVQANPASPVIEVFRNAVLGAGSVSAGGLLYSAICTLVLLLIGIVLFNRVEQNFMDTV
jgi:lipopolysaccharide transport system permease protein